MTELTGTVIVTGGTLGLGYQAALQIAQQRPEYLVMVVSRKDSDSSAAAINKATGRDNATWMPLDLSSLANVRNFAKEYANRCYPRLKALVLNAGLQISDLTYTVDGFETTFAVNHIGHAALFYLLRPCLAPDARIVIVSSGVHDPAKLKGVVYASASHLAHPTATTTAGATGRQRYASSKLANILWTYALAQRLRSSSSGEAQTVTAFNPGLMPGTGLARDAPPVLLFLWLYVFPHLFWLLRLLVSPNVHTPTESGFALARLAVGDDVGVRGKTGGYFDGLKEIKSSVDSYDKKKQDDLWAWTAKAVARDGDEGKRFEELL